MALVILDIEKHLFRLDYWYLLSSFIWFSVLFASYLHVQWKLIIKFQIFYGFWFPVQMLHRFLLRSIEVWIYRALPLSLRLKYSELLFFLDLHWIFLNSLAFSWEVFIYLLLYVTIHITSYLLLDYELFQITWQLIGIPFNLEFRKSLEIF